MSSQHQQQQSQHYQQQKQPNTQSTDSSLIPKRKLRDESTNPFMKETDPRNPYGPNYEEHPYETKLYYKYNKMRKFVHFSSEDQENILKKDYQYMGGLIGSVALSCVFGFTLKKFVFTRFMPRIGQFIEDNPSIYYGLFVASSSTYAYYTLGDYYVHSLCEPMMQKYLPAAIQNGFEDYEISKFKKIDAGEYLLIDQNEK